MDTSSHLNIIFLTAREGELLIALPKHLEFRGVPSLFNLICDQTQRLQTLLLWSRIFLSPRFPLIMIVRSFKETHLASLCRSKQWFYVRPPTDDKLVGIQSFLCRSFSYSLPFSKSIRHLACLSVPSRRCLFNSALFRLSRDGNLVYYSYARSPAPHEFDFRERFQQLK